jgi:DNA-3-methyladenine glycosylase II
MNGRWWQAFRLQNDKIAPVEVILNKDIDNPQLTVNIFADIEKDDELEIIERIKRVFNTGYDLKSLYAFMEKDERLKNLKDNHYGLLPASFSSVYESIIATIIQQQISLKIAWHMTALLIIKFGECAKIDDKEFWAFPTPSTLANADISELRKCKLSEGKGEYIKDFSEAVESGKFVPESLRKLSHQEIIERLTQFRGMGRWTAEMVIVTSIGLDGMNPAGDLGARKAISHFFNSDKLMSEDEVRKLTDKWGKYKGIITYYCIAEMLR